jgi:molecular chaperone DnaJ
VYRQAQTIFGATRTQTTCPYCQGTGKTIKRKCDTCKGDGHTTSERTIDVTIPAGINTNQQIRLSEKGEPGINGGPNGDLYIVINVRPHEIFDRQDNDIVMELPITFSQAALGDDIQTPTVHGNVTLKIPAGTQTGSRFRLRGKGVKSVNTAYTGDQHVIVKVVTPEKLDAEQKKIFTKLSKTNEMSSSVWKKFTGIFKE